jgi:hypothetical protein
MGAVRRIVLCAGELSGDMHAAHLVAALVSRVPGVAIEGMGGENCARAGIPSASSTATTRSVASPAYSPAFEVPRPSVLASSIRRTCDRSTIRDSTCACAPAAVNPVPDIAPQVGVRERRGENQRMVDSMAGPAVRKFSAAQVCTQVRQPFVIDHELPPPDRHPARVIALLPGAGRGRAILPVLLAAARALTSGG